jgi:hypothetical protein
MKQIIATLYVYCTDFVLNMAHLTGISYYEVNALLFCYMFPAVLIVLLLLNIYLKIRIYKIQKINKL